MNNFLNLIVLIGVFAAISTANEGEEKLMKILAKERKETKEMFQQENSRLRREDTKLRKVDAKLRKEDTKIRKEATKLREQVDKQNKKIAKLEEKLRQADLKTQKSIRQRDENTSLEFDTRLKNSMRQEDVHSEMKDIVTSVMESSIGERGGNSSLEIELRKLMKSEITNYLINEKICVSGTFNVGKVKEWRKERVNYGVTFPRKPTVTASISYFYHYNPSQTAYAQAYVFEVGNSSAVVGGYRYNSNTCYVAWIACL